MRTVEGLLPNQRETSEHVHVELLLPIRFAVLAEGYPLLVFALLGSCVSPLQYLPR